MKQKEFNEEGSAGNYLLHKGEKEFNLSEKRMQISYNGNTFSYGCKDEDIKEAVRLLKEDLDIMVSWEIGMENIASQFKRKINKIFGEELSK